MSSGPTDPNATRPPAAAGPGAVAGPVVAAVTPVAVMDPPAPRPGVRPTGLLATEWSRFFRRQFTLVMVLMTVAVSILVLLALAANSHRPTAYERAEARRQVAAELDRRASLTAECEAGRLPRDNCVLGAPPREEDYLPFGFRFDHQVEPMLYIGCLVLCLFGFIVGASFVGAEWTSGGMMNLLLWQPARGRVLAAKLVVALGGVLVVALGYLACWLAAGAVVGATIGTVGTFEPGQVPSLVLLGLRIVALVLGVTATGFGLASLGRRTVAAPGVAVAYAVFIEVGLWIVLATLRFGPGTGMFRMSYHIASWLTAQDLISERNACYYDGCHRLGFDFTWVHSGVLLGAVVGAVLAAAFLAMRHRDVA